MQKTAGPKKFISRFDDRQYPKNDIFVHFFNIKSLNSLEILTGSKSLRSLEVETSPLGRYSSQLLVELKPEKIVS